MWELQLSSLLNNKLIIDSFGVVGECKIERNLRWDEADEKRKTLRELIYADYNKIK